MRTFNLQLDEQLIVQKARNGDLNAFNQLILNYQSLAYNVAFRILRNEDDAADALQTSFLNAFHKVDQLESDHFKSWLMRIVVNRCYDMLRSRKRRTTLCLDHASEWVTEPTTDRSQGSELPEDFAERNECGDLSPLPDKWPFTLFLLHTVAFSVLLTWLYNHSGGSLWPVILAHAAFNLYPEPWAAAWQALPPEQRGFYPVIVVTVVEEVIALVVVRLSGPRLDQP